MAVSVSKIYSAGEVLSASDLNASFSKIHDNGEDLGWPATKAKDLDGRELILDSDGDTSITADSDDVIDVRVAGIDSAFIGHGTGNTAGFLHIDPLAHTVTASTNYALCRIGNSNAITIPAGTTTIAAGLSIGIPNWTATGTITNSATLYIEGAATEATTDYALWVDAGGARFDGNLIAGKGGDITSASPLVLDTDGVYFDVTGVTGFSQITVPVNTLFMLQFDSVLTMTDGANLDLGGANIVTETGDRALFYAPAANTAQLMAYFAEAGWQRNLGVADGPQFGTIELGAATDTTLSRSAAGVIAVEGQDVLMASVDDTLTAGFQYTVDDNGTKSSGTFTPTYAGGNVKKAINGGAHTLAPQSGDGTLILQYTNNVSAGAITASGWDAVTGDAFTTVDGQDFMVYLTVIGTFQHLHIVVLQ